LFSDQISGGLLAATDYSSSTSYFNAVYPLKQHETAIVRPKTLADLIESIIGGFYVEGGLEAGVCAIRALGAWPTLNDNNKKKYKNADRIENDQFTTSNGLSNIPLVNSLQVPSIQIKHKAFDPIVFPDDYPEPLKRVAMGLVDDFTSIKSDCKDSENILQVKILEKSFVKKRETSVASISNFEIIGLYYFSIATLD
jgi:hypothetical protein